MRMRFKTNGDEGNMVETLLLVLTAALAAAAHTLIPDHWLPYVLMSRGKGWSMGKTMRVTSVGAIIHLAATAIVGVLIGFIGVATLKGISDKADLIGGVLLLLFGLYFVWKGWKAYKIGGGHSHAHHAHGGGHSHYDDQSHPHHDHSHDELHKVHDHHEHSHDHSTHQHSNDHTHDQQSHHYEDNHDHGHHQGHTHSHEKLEKSDVALGAILGARPCAEAIPIFLAAGAIGLTSSLLAVISWVIATIVCMLGMVWLSLKGMEASKLKIFDKFGELGAGVLIVIVGGIMMIVGM